MADEVTNAIDFNDIKQSVEECLGRTPEDVGKTDRQWHKPRDKDCSSRH